MGWGRCNTRVKCVARGCECSPKSRCGLWKPVGMVGWSPFCRIAGGGVTGGRDQNRKRLWVSDGSASSKAHVLAWLRIGYALVTG